jgi:uncharacterized protein YabN with tetrapyrrole methylase and pyrophosphatase domain
MLISDEMGGRQDEEKVGDVDSEHEVYAGIVRHELREMIGMKIARLVKLNKGYDFNKETYLNKFHAKHAF